MEDVQQELQYALSAKRKGILPVCVHQNKWNSYIQAVQRGKLKMGCSLKQLVMRMKRQHRLHLYSLMARQWNLNWTLGLKLQLFPATHLRPLGVKSRRLHPKFFMGPGKQPLDVMGQVTYKNAHSQEPSRKRTEFKLTGLPALRALQLVARTDAISQYEKQIYQKHPHLFTGLGTLGPEYTIKLKANTLPYVLSTLRSVPLPLRDKVKKELDRMESMGVISRVDGPSEWCAGMVVVPKKGSESVRICVDLRPLNESVLRENFPLPKVDENLAQLSGATVFSKLDANCGFWQIPLAKHVQLLTTFITPFGRYCFTKLPFGISCAPELFQKRMSDILQDIERKLCQMDDVLVFGSSQEEHDDRLKAV
eukprot:Em0004g851a